VTFDPWLSVRDDLFITYYPTHCLQTSVSFWCQTILVLFPNIEIVFTKLIFSTILFIYFISKVILSNLHFDFSFLVIRNSILSFLCLYSSMIVALLEVIQSIDFTFYLVNLTEIYNFKCRFLPYLIFKLQFDIILQVLQPMTCLVFFLF
jgi:hypothetical protein